MEIEQRVVYGVTLGSDITVTVTFRVGQLVRLTDREFEKAIRDAEWRYQKDWDRIEEWVRLDREMAKEGEDCETTGTPMPGSEEARVSGCRCDGIDGVVLDCPVHGPVRRRMPMRDKGMFTL